MSSGSQALLKVALANSSAYKRALRTTRALLIEKDQSPKWSVSNIDDLSQSLIDEHFVGHWDGAGRLHPLADLLDIDSAG